MKVLRARVRKPRPPRPPAPPVPKFFKRACARAEELGKGYRRAGRLLADRLVEVVDARWDPDWRSAVEDLRDLINRDEVDNVLFWFRHYLPKYLALVPIRRRYAFAWAVIEADQRSRCLNPARADVEAAMREDEERTRSRPSYAARQKKMWSDLIEHGHAPDDLGDLDEEYRHEW